jgi:hypothetical protein
MSMLLGAGYYGSADLKRAVSHVHTRLKDILGGPSGILSRGVGWTSLGAHFECLFGALKNAPKRPIFRINFGIFCDFRSTVDLKYSTRARALRPNFVCMCVHVMSSPGPNMGQSRACAAMVK